MSTSPGRGGLLAAIRSRFTALHPGQPCDCGRSAGTEVRAGLLLVWLELGRWAGQASTEVVNAALRDLSDSF